MEPTTTHSTASDPPNGPTGPPDPAASAIGSPVDRLHRSREDRMVAGVAAGLADYLGIDPTLVRIGFVALSLLGGLAVPLYLAGWLLIPEQEGGPSVAEELWARERAC